MSHIVERADYHNTAHATAIADLLDEYAADPMGRGRKLDADVKARLVAELAKRPYAFSVLAFVDGRPAGLANCFEGFSTFAARPLVNIHDVVVSSPWRGQGVGLALLGEIERIARARDCCKITLEVRQHNPPAMAAYRRFGFSDGAADDGLGLTLFLQKRLA